MKNKNLAIVLTIGLLVLVGGAYFVFSSKREAPESITPEPQIVPEEKINTLSADDIGLILTTGNNNRKVIMEVANIGDISSLDYELSYMSKGDIPRGAIGHIDIKSKTRPVRQEIVLGTCSDVCHYDEDVSDIKLILKVAKIDGTISQVEKSLEL